MFLSQHPRSGTTAEAASLPLAAQSCFAAGRNTPKYPVLSNPAETADRAQEMKGGQRTRKFCRI